MKRSPLLIISASRSGSSMTAGIFAHHGYWVGTCRDPDRHNAKGYFENLAVKHFMRRFYNTNVDESRQGRILQPREGFKESAEWVIKQDGYEDDGSPWLIKFGANYYPPWRAIYPDCTVICLYRRMRAIMASGRRSFRVTQKRIEAAFETMDNALKNDEDGSVFRVDYEAVVNGYYGQISKVFKREGVEMDHDRVDGFIDPELKHF